MVLRISLLVAILASLATLYVTHVRLQDRITTLASQRDSARTGQRTAEQSQLRAETDRRQAREDLAKVSKQLADEAVTLEATRARLIGQEKRANEASENLTNLRGELNAAQDALALWQQIGWSPAQIRGFRQELATVREDRDALSKENRILLRRYSQLDSRLKSLIGPDEEVKMPVGLTGKVLAVDPKYDFVVLNIGGDQGVVQNGKLLVSREGKLISTLRVAKVESNWSIANVLPDHRSDVTEGDRVTY